MRHSTIAIVCSALLIGCSSVRDSDVTSQRNRTVDLPTGTIELPRDFIYFQGQGIDSYVGDFTRTDGRFRISYDIGLMAGVATSQAQHDIVSSNTMTVGKLTAIVVVTRWHEMPEQAVISFPETTANFFAVIRDDSELETMKQIVSTYKPKGDSPTK
jgi:hypothetical protein